jgi:hypothetical protein
LRERVLPLLDEEFGMPTTRDQAKPRGAARCRTAVRPRLAGGHRPARARPPMPAQDRRPINVLHVQKRTDGGFRQH